MLRSNKQTGPHTLEEIQAMGLKAYDLVWVEGKSAAWRYPGEIEALKAFAPLVEEQPYDRFYKKPQPSIHPALAATQSNSSSPISVLQRMEQDRRNQESSSQRQAPVFAQAPPADVKKHAEPYISAADQRPAAMEHIGIAENREEKRPQRMEQDSVPYQGGGPRSNEIVRPNAPASRPAGGASRRTEWSSPVPIIWDDNSSATTDSTGRAATRKEVSPKPSAPLTSFLKPFVFGFGLASFLGFGILIGIYISNNMSHITPPVKDVAVKEDNTDGNQHALYHPQDMPLVQAPGTDNGKNGNNGGSQNQADLGGERDKSVNSDKQVSKPKHKLMDSIALARPKLRMDSSALIPVPRDVHAADASLLKENIKDNIGHYVQLSGNKYSVGTFGGIDELQLTVSNKSLYPLDLVVVEVQYIQSNKKVFKTENLYFRNISAGSALMEEAPKSSRGVKVQYRITLINSKDLGISFSGM